MNKQFDFTFGKFSELLDSFILSGYTCQSLEDYLNNPAEKAVILRHDVDRSPINSLQTAILENSKGIRGTYYFRIVKKSNDRQVIQKIAALGHEVGYHYEDLSLTDGLQDAAISSFVANLEYFRTLYPVKTICMHGSPVSKWDNRDLWKNYSYRDFGIIAEPYFDLNWEKVLYLTDTGRKWNGERSSIRDKVVQEKYYKLKQSLNNSDHIIAALQSSELPDHIMITVHPQRWSDSLFNWIWEYGAQKLKNGIKKSVYNR